MIELRDYQIRAIQRVFAAWRAGARSVICVAPTGSGKRYLALWLMDYAAKAGRKVLFVGNRRLLVTQAQNDAERFEIDHGIIMANNEGGNAASGNQIASIQTLESWYFFEKWTGAATGEGLPPANLIVIDEGHQDTGRYQQLLGFYPDAKVLVLTATPVGPEGRSLVPSPFDVIVEPVLNSELIHAGHLLPTRVFAPSEPNLQGVRTQSGAEYNQSSLGRAVQSCTVFADVFREWERYQDQATVCFVPGIAFGRDLVNQFNSRLGQSVSAWLIEAKTKPNEREEIFERVKSGDAKVLVSCDVLREGFDLPLLSVGIDLQPNSQLRSYWQKVGRIKRPFGEQSIATWLDFAGNYWRFPHPNEDPEWPVGGEETTQQAIERTRKAKGESEPIMCPKCSLVRARGPKCPGCGHESSQPVRRIRMGPGELVEVPAVARKTRELTAEQRLYNKWKGRLYAALKSGCTFSQAAMLFRRETGQWPQEGWPGVFEKSSLEWRRRPADLYDRAGLYRALER